MPITFAFTVTGVVAFFFNGWFLLRALRRRRQQKASGENGRLTKIALSFVQIWVFILLADSMIVIAGLGILVGVGTAGYLIALVPVISIAVGVSALRGFD